MKALVYDGAVHLADGVRELGHHVLHGLQQAPGLVGGLGLDAHREVALGERVRDLDGACQRA